jgi:hypothetical protein
MARTSSKPKSAAGQSAAQTPQAPSEAAASTSTSATPAPTATDAPPPYRENEQTNKKIDDWIKRYPDQFKFFNEMPHERAVRKLILNEIDRYERRQFRKQQENGENNSPRQERGQGQGGGRRY